MKRDSDTEREKILADFKTSALNQARFARERGLSVATLRYWLQKERNADATGPFRMVPVRLLSEGTENPQGLELEFGEFRVRFPSGTDPEYFGQILDELKFSC